jgi:hypothetical protein
LDKKNRRPSKKEEEEMLHMLKQLSPEALRRAQKDINALFVKILAKSKTAEELIKVRDKLLAPSPFPQPPIIVERSPFKAVKGGRPQKKIRQTLKGKFDL